jgi:hypothetical protein
MRYTQDQAAEIFRQQFGGGESGLYYPEGTPADALNTGTDEFGPYNVGPSDRDIALKDPWQPTATTPTGYEGSKHPLDTPPPPPAIPWETIALVVGGGALVWWLMSSRRHA